MRIREAIAEESIVDFIIECEIISVILMPEVKIYVLVVLIVIGWMKRKRRHRFPMLESFIQPSC